MNLHSNPDNMVTNCDVCQRERQPHDGSYDPWQLIMYRHGTYVGWYSGSDGEICGDCMLGLYQKGNG